MTYTPDAGAFGADSFTYRATDGTADSAPGDRLDHDHARRRACDDVSRRTAVGAAVSVPLTCTDPDGDTLTLSIVDGPSKGSLGAIAGGAVTYTPDAGEFGDRLVHLPRHRRHRRVGAGHRHDHDHAPAGLRRRR